MISFLVYFVVKISFPVISNISTFAKSTLNKLKLKFVGLGYSTIASDVFEGLGIIDDTVVFSSMLENSSSPSTFP